MSPLRIALFSLLGAGVLATAISVSNPYESHHSIAPDLPVCDQTANEVILSGPGMTAKEVEDNKAAEDKRLGIKTPTPFGRINNEWVEFKRKAEPDDRFYSYVGNYAGGYARVRGTCVLDTFMTWIS